MSFRDRMRVETSNAEVKVLIRLQQMDLIQKMHPLGTTILFMETAVNKTTVSIEASFYNREDVTVTLLSRAQGFTIPDFPFLKDKLPTYLDGPVHKRSSIADRDDRINKMLRRSGLDPLRFAYNPPLSNKRLEQICIAIQRNLELEP